MMFTWPIPDTYLKRTALGRVEITIWSPDWRLKHCSNTDYERNIILFDFPVFRAHRAYYISGQQKIAKFNEAARNTVNIHMGVFRVPEFSTDIVVSFNDPVNIE